MTEPAVQSVSSCKIIKEKALRLKDIIKNPDIIGIGNNVDVKGWVRTKRGNNFVQFIALNDGSIVTNLQIVVDKGIYT